MDILFHTNQISERGTEVALFDYAKGNVDVLRGRSFIACPQGNIQEYSVLEKFELFFPVFLYQQKSELDEFIVRNRIQLIYLIVSGDRDEMITRIVPTFIHCVFSTVHRYGAYYSPISEYLNQYYRTHYPVLPHIVKRLPTVEGDLRTELGIPKEAVVFGGYGGAKQFNLDFVRRAVFAVAQRLPNVFFIFMNFDAFGESSLPNLIFLPKSTDLEYKARFVKTCDAMLHARNDGETFGLSIAEFSTMNKPVLTWKPSWRYNFKFCLRELFRYWRKRPHVYAKAHLHFLGDKGIYYHAYADLVKKIIHFKKDDNINYDCYSERFSEERVMETFAEIVGVGEK